MCDVDVVDEMGDEGLECVRIAQDRENVEEGNSLLLLERSIDWDQMIIHFFGKVSVDA